MEDRANVVPWMSSSLVLQPILYVMYCVCSLRVDNACVNLNVAGGNKVLLTCKVRLIRRILTVTSW